VEKKKERDLHLNRGHCWFVENPPNFNREKSATWVAQKKKKKEGNSDGKDVVWKKEFEGEDSPQT